jgi:hypothetical protein
LKRNGQKSLEGLLNQLEMIDDLGRSISLRTSMIAKSYSFASSFSSIIQSSMNKVIYGAK